MNILTDTNVLARLAQPHHRHYPIALNAVAALRTRNDSPCIVPQVIYEFWSVATRPVDQYGLGLSVPEATAEVAEIKILFKLFRDERAIFQGWERLVAAHDVKGKGSHDARLVAAMYRHGLTHILTFNARDFVRYPGITILSPESVA